MHFDTQFQNVMQMVQSQSTNRETWEAASGLLEEIEASNQDQDEQMVCMLATWAIQASGYDEDYHVTKRIHQMYDQRLRAFFYNGIDPIEFHRFTKKHPAEAAEFPEATLQNIDGYRNVAFPAMKAYFYYDQVEDAIEAGAWHLFTLAVLPRRGHPANPSYALNGPTVEHIQKMGHSLQGNEQPRRAILKRTAELLRLTGRDTEASLIEACVEPKIQRILEAGVLFDVDTPPSSDPSQSHREPHRNAFNKDKASSKSHVPKTERHRELPTAAFSTTATFEEPPSTKRKLMLGAAALIGLGVSWILLT